MFKKFVFKLNSSQTLADPSQLAGGQQMSNLILVYNYSQTFEKTKLMFQNLKSQALSIPLVKPQNQDINIHRLRLNDTLQSERPEKGSSTSQITPGLNFDSFKTDSPLQKNQIPSTFPLLMNLQQTLLQQLLAQRVYSSLIHLSSLSQKNQEEIKDSFETTPEPINIKTKKIKKYNRCGHSDRPHYAKNMCNQCYHKFGRTKRPWKCSHLKLYAHGLCQNCYINAYNKVIEEKRSEKVSKLFAKNTQTTIEMREEPTETTQECTPELKNCE